MGIQYTSLEFIGTKLIPAGGFATVAFPFATETYDAWNMHARTGPGQTESEFVIVPADGIAVISTELVWLAGPYTLTRHGIIHNGVRKLVDRRPAASGIDNLTTATGQLRVKRGDSLHLQVGHNHGTQQTLLEAQLKISLHPQAEPPTRRVRVRKGHNPVPFTPPEGPPESGDGIPQTPVPPDTDHIPR